MGFRAFDRVCLTAASAPGTAAFQIGGALSGYQTLAAAGAAYGDTFSYIINDGSSWELGVGTYATASGNLYVERASILTSAGNATPLTLSSSAICTATIRAADLGLPLTQQGTGLVSNAHFSAAGVSVADTLNGISLQAGSGISTSRCGVSFIYKAAPATPYTLTVKLAATYTSSGYAGASVGWYDGSSKLHVLALVAQAGAAPRLEFQKWSAPGTFVANDTTWSNTFFNQPFAYPTWLQINDTGTNLNLAVSQDGGYFASLGSYSKGSAYLGSSGYTNLLFGLNLCENVFGATLQQWSGA